MRKTNTNTRRPLTDRVKKNTEKKGESDTHRSGELEENAVRLFKSLFSDVQSREGKNKG
jgi:hypothetical protein